MLGTFYRYGTAEIPRGEKMHEETIAVPRVAQYINNESFSTERRQFYLQDRVFFIFSRSAIKKELYNNICTI